ncbi:MAG: hypothetical protein ACRBFS_23015 [Aureispira sp.]
MLEENSAQNQLPGEAHSFLNTFTNANTADMVMEIHTHMVGSPGYGQLDAIDRVNLSYFLQELYRFQEVFRSIQEHLPEVPWPSNEE